MESIDGMLRLVAGRSATVQRSEQSAMPRETSCFEVSLLQQPLAFLGNVAAIILRFVKEESRKQFQWMEKWSCIHYVLCLNEQTLQSLLEKSDCHVTI